MAGLLCRIYIQIARVFNALCSSVFKSVISNYFYIYSELKTALQGEATVFVSGLLS